MPRTLAHLLVEARRRLLIGSQGELGELLGSSRRSGQRWERGEATPSGDQIVGLARLVHPKDAGVARELAEHAGTTLAQLGLEKPPAPGQPPADAGPPPALAPEAIHCVDTVVCAAAEAMNVMPDEIRPALRAAFRRARLARLSVELIDTGLGGQPPPPTDGEPNDGARGRTARRGG